MPALPPKRSANLPEAKFAADVARYVDISAKMKPLDAEKKKLSAVLKEYVSTHGTAEECEDGKVPTKTVTIGGVVVSVCTPQKTVVDEEKAADVLEAKGLLESCTKRVLNEQAVLVAFQEGKLTAEEVNSFISKEDQTPRISVTTRT